MATGAKPTTPPTSGDMKLPDLPDQKAVFSELTNVKETLTSLSPLNGFKPEAALSLGGKNTLAPEFNLKNGEMPNLKTLAKGMEGPAPTTPEPKADDTKRLK